LEPAFVGSNPTAPAGIADDPELPNERSVHHEVDILGGEVEADEGAPI
jgi:hypothetical protein